MQGDGVVGYNAFGRQKDIPVMRKILLQAQWKQIQTTCFADDLQQNEKAGTGQGKQSLPANQVQRCCDGERQRVVT